MLRAVLIDDEIRVCSLIRELVDWDAAGVVPAASFQNSADAYAYIRAHRPEIIITDIHMPGMDGVRLLRTLRAEGICCEVLLISGEQSFSHAQTALEFDVAGYLLKPLHAEDIQRNLRRAVRRYLNGQSAPTDTGSTQEYGALDRRIGHRQLLGALADGTLSAHRPEQLNALFSTEFRPGRFLVLSGRIRLLRCGEERQAATLRETVLGRIRRGLSRYCFAAAAGFAAQELVWIVNYADRLRLDRVVADSLSETNRRLRQDCVLTIGYSNPAEELTPALYRESRRAMQGFLILGEGRAISVSDLPDSSAFSIPKSCRSALRSGFRALEEGAAAEAFSEVARICRAGVPEPGQVLSFCEDALRMLREERPETAPETEGRFRRILAESGSVPELLDKACACVVEELRRQSAMPGADEGRAVYTARRYVLTHLRGEIRLDDVARLVYMSPTYFSAFFRRKTGQTFSDYVTGCRMERAKELLEDGCLSVAAVGEAVGYRDPAYFSRQFAKLTGIRASVYREKCRQDKKIQDI